MPRPRLALHLALPLAALALAAPRVSDACQYPECHNTGAVALPADFGLSLPFKAGEKVLILSGYGPSAGSSLHCRAQDSQCANDYYALDLILPDYPNSGKGQPVVAAASGTVLDAGWGTQGWASYGQRVYIKHDYDGDGHTYVTMYAHLDTVAVSKGQKVGKGALLGTLGQSCNEAKTCGNFSTPHVHFSVHRDPGFGGTGSGGSYGGRAVIPEPLDGSTGIQKGQTLTSMNGDEPEPEPEPQDCGLIPPSGATLEDDGPCCLHGGKPEMYGEIDGHGGHAFTTALDNPSPDYAEGGTWQLFFEQAGDYELKVYIPAALQAGAAQATYKISYSGQATKVLVDHAANLGAWVSLGVFPFALGDGQWVRLGDNYDLAGDQGKLIGIDALAIAPPPACACMAGQIETLPCVDGGEQSRTCDGCNWSEWSACSDAGTTGDATTGGETSGSTGGGTGTSGGGTGTSGGGTGTSGADDSSGGSSGSASASAGATSVGSATASGFEEPGETSGCGCRADGAPRLAALGPLLLALALRRRRRG